MAAVLHCQERLDYFNRKRFNQQAGLIGLEMLLLHKPANGLIISG
jgi:hypothetical protein